MTQTLHRLALHRCAGITIALATLAILAAPTRAQAQDQKVKIAYVRAPQLISHWHAEKLGLLKREGIDAEIVTLNNGPAVAAAVTSGSVDIGWTAAVPIITAVEQNQPFKVFVTSGLEGPPNPWSAYLVASGKSGIKSLAELKGRTIITNAVGGACELSFRTQLRKVGLSFDDVKSLIVPFPQVAAALELGNGDVACQIEPFVTGMRLGGKINPLILVTGVLPDLDKKPAIPSDAYFARAEWIGKNAKIAAGFRRALEAANKDLIANDAVYRQYLVDEFKMPKALAEGVGIAPTAGSQIAVAAIWQPVIDAMLEEGMIKKRLKAEDFVVEVRN